MGFKCGIVGLPNIGKSTLFNVLTKGNSAVANFPFCTIKPNIGKVSVFDKRINKLADIVVPKKIIHAYIEFIDIAGLVEGASQGEGLGNQFLNHIRETNAIAHVVRCFKDNKVSHVYDEIKPERDIDIINTELILSDLDICEKTLLKLKKKTTLINTNVEKKVGILEKCVKHLTQCLMLRNLNLNSDERKHIDSLRLLTLKPTMYIANINEEKESFSYLKKVCHIAKKENSPVIPISANLELDLIDMHETEKIAFMKAFNIKSLGLNSIIIEGYKLLKLITFFTVGKKEIRAWSILDGSTSLQAAHKIHSDFRKGFISVQIIKYNDFIKYKNEVKIKEIGKFKTEGKNYQIKDGDIVRFLFNV